MYVLNNERDEINCQMPLTYGNNKWKTVRKTKVEVKGIPI